MRKEIILIIVFISISGLIFAQKKESSYKFHSINNVGLVNGSNAVSASLQSVNGFKKDSWFAGIGVGLDYYLYRTVPVFADLRYEFGKKKNKYFVYADAGLNINWVKDNFIDPPSIWNRFSSTDFKNGFYNDIGMGYSIRMKKENAIVLSIGYSHKNLKETQSYQDWRTPEFLTRQNSYNLRRIMIKAGWQF